MSSQDTYIRPIYRERQKFFKITFGCSSIVALGKWVFLLYNKIGIDNITRTISASVGRDCLCLFLLYRECQYLATFESKGGKVPNYFKKIGNAELAIDNDSDGQIKQQAICTTVNSLYFLWIGSQMVKAAGCKPVTLETLVVQIHPYPLILAAVNLLNRIGVSLVEINAAFFYYMK